MRRKIQSLITPESLERITLNFNSQTNMLPTEAENFVKITQKGGSL